MSGHPQCRLEAPSSSERVDISQSPPPSPHNHPWLLGSWSSPGFLITGQRKHLAFLSWSAEWRRLCFPGHQAWRSTALHPPVVLQCQDSPGCWAV